MLSACISSQKLRRIETLSGRIGCRPGWPAAMKRGLARAFLKFDEYALGKYNRDAAVKLRDVLFLCHAKADTPDAPGSP